MPKIVLIGGSKSNVGKTTLARIILSLFHKSFIALKITNNLTHGVGITEETYETSPLGKDTYYLLKDALKVFWARGYFDYLKREIPPILNNLESPVLVEGNVFYRIVKPDLFLFVESPYEPIKEDAKELIKFSDFVIINGDCDFKIEGKSVFVNLKRNLESINPDFKDFLTKTIKALIF